MREAIINPATPNAAQALEMGDEVGTLEDGTLADLNVMDGNTLDDRTTLEDPEVVVQGGAVVNTD